MRGPFKQGISMITLGVENLALSRAFYEALGWKAHASSQETIVFFQMNQMLLALYGKDGLAEEFEGAEAYLAKGPVTLAQNFSSKAEVDQAFAMAVEAGAKALKQPVEVFWGGYSGYIADPDGHLWELAMNPFWHVGEDASIVLSTDA